MHRRPRRFKNEINVVPYVDVMLVLLVIFMVSAPMMTIASINVPSVARAANAPDRAIQVNIHADESLSLTIPGSQPERKANLGALAESIIKAMGDNPDQPVLIVGDKTIRYEAVINVMDALQRHEIRRVALLVQRDRVR
jgi:biopolymer transport protein TolR